MGSRAHLTKYARECVQGPFLPNDCAQIMFCRIRRGIVEYNSILCHARGRYGILRTAKMLCPLGKKDTTKIY